MEKYRKKVIGTERPNIVEKVLKKIVALSNFKCKKGKMLKQKKVLMVEICIIPGDTMTK